MKPRKLRTCGLLLAAFACLAVTCSAADPASAKPESATAGKQLDVWWVDLEKPEPEASRALLNLAARPEEVVPFLKEKLRPLRIDTDQVKALLEKLASDREDVWKPAYEELEYLDPRLAVDLPTLMKDVAEAPARARLVALLSGDRPLASLEGKTLELRPSGGDSFNFFDGRGSWWAERKVSRLTTDNPWGNPKKKWTRAIRAIVLLERIGTPEAVGIIREMATGHPDAQPTKIAKDALDRVTEKSQ